MQQQDNQFSETIEREMFRESYFVLFCVTAVSESTFLSVRCVLVVEFFQSLSCETNILQQIQAAEPVFVSRLVFGCVFKCALKP